MAPQKINIKEHLTDGEIDLSMSDLQDVPVKDIAVFKKAVSLDLSNNHLKALPGNFATLTHITKLDLSKNHLTALPENFGDLVKLKSLDLYQNQLQHLPLSFSKLKSLKWLDLKDNPLEPAVAKVAGPCLDSKQCQTCAKDIVNFFTQVQEQLASDIEQRQKQRQKQLEANQQKEMENKKNKKKEKLKQKKENGPIKENVPKPANKKNKKSAAAEKNQKRQSSRCLSIVKRLIVLCVSLLVFHILISGNERLIEDTWNRWYKAVSSPLPPNTQEYLLTVGGYLKFWHEKSANVTIEAAGYVKNKDNWVNACYTLNEYIQTILQKIKDVYRENIS